MKKYILFSLSIVLFISCHSVPNDDEALSLMLNSIKSHYVPDSRLGVFDIEIKKENNKKVLVGSTTNAHVIKEIKENIGKILPSVEVDVKVLPDQNLGSEIYGVINNSVINMRIKPGFSSGMAKQALLGEKITLLEEKGGWYRAKTSDGYISWLIKSAFTTMDEIALNEWDHKTKVIYTQDYGSSVAIENRNQKVSDLVYGNLLAVDEDRGKYYIVLYPDGRKAIVQKNEVTLLEEWTNTRKLTQQNLLATAKTFMGVPYSWGGNSYKGVDCSGFTSSVYGMNGMQIPRDASLQVLEGTEIDTLGHYSKLEVGDLLFFGRKATEDKTERVVHVGMWIGNGQFIHSQGNVHISSFDKTSPFYDEFNLNRFLRVKRIFENNNI
ncbi:C40 family peptidase [Flammeovirga sp. EKP202]|uniref:C40 family peptidase n=1 Tax=Flammeovirga sp. EKP202 TaxID=2770592 RepID=UPI00165F3597|nr:C40 family peptidase [Flammeovirga sp. EKP202]MBD0403628.1 C40 family peptidase [Flammeovirga sp. EKP202]